MSQFSSVIVSTLLTLFSSSFLFFFVRFTNAKLLLSLFYFYFFNYYYHIKEARPVNSFLRARFLQERAVKTRKPYSIYKFFYRRVSCFFRPRTLNPPSPFVARKKRRNFQQRFRNSIEFGRFLRGKHARLKSLESMITMTKRPTKCR